MIIVRRRAELVRFGLFLVLTGAMAYFIAAKVEAWRVARTNGNGTSSATSFLTGSRGIDIINQAKGSPEGADFFADFRVSREKNRGAQRETLRELINSDNADVQTRREASQRLLEMNRLVALEKDAEELVKAKGYEEAVVHLGDNAAQVVIRAKNLLPEQFMQVIDLVSRVTGMKQNAVQVLNRER